MTPTVVEIVSSTSCNDGQNYSEFGTVTSPTIKTPSETHHSDSTVPQDVENAPNDEEQKTDTTSNIPMTSQTRRHSESQAASGSTSTHKGLPNCLPRPSFSLQSKSYVWGELGKRRRIDRNPGTFFRELVCRSNCAYISSSASPSVCKYMKEI